MDEWNHLVVVLPGIGGSVLAEPDSGGRPGKVVWSAGFPNISLLARPSLLSRERHPSLVPVGLIPTRRLFGLWTPVHGYDGLLRLLGSIPGAVVDDGTPQGRNPRANVVAVGYDFRLGIADAAKTLQAQIAVRLDELWPGRKRHDGKVIVVAHSLGGLVARYWVAQEGGAQLCRAIITLGTPHRGAPKALDILANGIPVAGKHLSGPRSTLREWPSMWELLPRYRAIHDLTRKQPATVAPPAAAEEASESDPDSVEELLYPSDLPLFAERAAEGMKVHRMIDAGWMGLEIPPDINPRIGYGHATPTWATWDGQTVRVTDSGTTGPATPFPQLGQWGAQLGDGTVPAFCGLPISMSNRPMPELGVPARHGPIAVLPEVVNMVNSYLGFPTLTPIRGDQSPTEAVLGLDVAEVQQVNQPAPLVARPAGLTPAQEVELGTQQVCAGVSPINTETGALAGPPIEFNLDWDGAGGYRGELPPLGAGGYELRVTAERIGPGLRVTQLLEVIESDSLD